MSKEKKDATLTHSIPLGVMSTSPGDFINQVNKTKFANMPVANEHRDVKPMLTQGGLQMVYTWYGEGLCTKKDFDSWCFKNQIKERLIGEGIRGLYSGKRKKFYTNKLPSGNLLKDIEDSGFTVSHTSFKE